MWRQIFVTFVLKVTGYRPTHACKDNQLCAGFKVGIGGAVNGAQYIWEANSTEENWDFYLLTQIMSLMKLTKSECSGWFVIYGCLGLVLFLTAIVTSSLLY